MSLVAAFQISADDMFVTDAIFQEAISRSLKPEIPKPNVVALQASLIQEPRVYDLVDNFREQSSITVTLLDTQGQEIDKLDFPQGSPPPRYPAF